MIDVMMFLLVFFVLVSINVIPALGIKMKLPESSHARPSQVPKRLMVSIPPEGAVTLDGRAIENLYALAQALRAARQSNPEGLSVVVQGDQGTRMQRLVDVMDVLQQEGIPAMTISATKR